jgi:hypothetical protein
MGDGSPLGFGGIIFGGINPNQLKSDRIWAQCVRLCLCAQGECASLHERDPLFQVCAIMKGLRQRGDLRDVQTDSSLASRSADPSGLAKACSKNKTGKDGLYQESTTLSVGTSE